MYGKIQASGLTEFIAFICTSAIWAKSCFLVHLKQWQLWQMAAPCAPPAPQQSPWRVDHHGGWITMASGSPWRVAASAGLSFGSPHSHLEARNHWWLWHFLFIDLAVELFIWKCLLISSTLVLHATLPQVLATTILFFIPWAWLFSIPHRRGFMWYLSVCFWLISLGIMSSRWVHVVS